MQIVNRQWIWGTVMVALAVLSVNCIAPSLALPSLRRSVVKPSITVCPAPFVLILAPNPQSSWGIAAIVPTRSSPTPRQQAGLAHFGYDQLKRSGKKWKRFSLFVFDQKTNAKKLATLRTPSCYGTINRANASSLKRYWNQVSVYYEYRNSKGYIFYPQKNPTASWNALLK